MMTRYRTKQRYILAVLAVFVGFVSIGFAAFSETLIISSNAMIKPDSSAFKVAFSSSSTELATDKISGVGSGGAEGGSATIDNDGDSPTISDLTAKFTDDGQSVTYTFYVRNDGAYTAYLNDITFNYVDGESQAKVCTAIDSTNTTGSLMTAACNDITLTVAVGGVEATGTMNGISEHNLDKSSYETVVVTIAYASNDNLSDGDFTVEFGDITLSYSSKD